MRESTIWKVYAVGWMFAAIAWAILGEEPSALLAFLVANLCGYTAYKQKD